MIESTFNVKEIKFVLFVQDMDRAVKFYRDVVGLELKSSSPHWSELTFQNAIVAFHSGGSGKFCPTGLSFTVNDIKTAVHKVSNGGGIVRSEPEDRCEEGIILAELTDTEGNGFMISQNKSN